MMIMIILFDADSNNIDCDNATMYVINKVDNTDIDGSFGMVMMVDVVMFLCVIFVCCWCIILLRRRFATPFPAAHF